MVKYIFFFSFRTTFLFFVQALWLPPSVFSRYRYIYMYWVWSYAIFRVEHPFSAFFCPFRCSTTSVQIWYKIGSIFASFFCGVRNENVRKRLPRESQRGASWISRVVQRENAFTLNLCSKQELARCSTEKIEALGLWLSVFCCAISHY